MDPHPATRVPVAPLDRARLVYRWDLDKTYLRTEFDTVRDLLKTAFEKPDQKRTVPGAAALLRELQATNPASVFILSGSPEQMRKVLEAKLRLDGIQWDSFTLKPSLKKLLRGRFRFLKDQVGYKLAALLGARVELEEDLDEVLFGDDAEADAFIYSLYSDICAGRVAKETLVAVLERARVHEDDIPDLVRMAEDIRTYDGTRQIFIHLDRVSPVAVFNEFGSRVCPIYNYFQPACVLVEEGALDGDAALRVGAEIVIQHAFSPDALIASFMDVVRRGHVGGGAARHIIEAFESGDRARYAGAAPALEGFARDVERRLPELAEVEAVTHPEIDYVGLFTRDKARARAARGRARRRNR
ncbi:MAG: hypothetical protein DRJ42_15585 [Deltaproteobacteria bacterium]|nr:MAG: hypothetical protein DRJ42_15585 [Deltaproteobacteria bacterium]